MRATPECKDDEQSATDLYCRHTFSVAFCGCQHPPPSRGCGGSLLLAWCPGPAESVSKKMEKQAVKHSETWHGWSTTSVSSVGCRAKKYHAVLEGWAVAYYFARSPSLMHPLTSSANIQKPKTHRRHTLANHGDGRAGRWGRGASSSRLSS